MTDNRTTELRDKLDVLNIEHFDYDKGGRTQTQWEAPDGKRHFTYETSNNPAKTARLVIAWHSTPEQAIAATLGSDMESELRGALNEVADKWATAQIQAEDYARRCKLLEVLVRDLIPYVCADDGIEDIEARMRALGLGGVD